MITAEDIKNIIIPIISGPFTIAELVARVVNILTIAAGVIAFFYLIFSGFLYITAGSNSDQAKKALQGIINVIIGMIIISLSYLLVRVVIDLINNIAS